MNPIVSEQDSQLPGSITTHLALENNRLVGTITNTLNTPLSDLYILFPHSFVPIKHIGAGATVTINSPVYTLSAFEGHRISVGLYRRPLNLANHRWSVAMSSSGAILT